MIIEISRIAEGGARLAGEEPASILELKDEDGVRVEKPIRYDLMVEVVPGEVVVRGTLEADARYICSRCARDYPSTVKVPRFVRVKAYTGINAQVDLTEDIREDIILGFPSYPVCSPECKGLCFQCGADLNRGACSCKPPEGSSAWNALDGLM